jgi:uncharacterized membrane protein YdbT with pleckstrin-like domain
MATSHKAYKRGKKTLFYLFITKGWWLALIGFLFLFSSWMMYFGNWHEATLRFLASHPDWFISVSMLSGFFIMVGISFIFVGYLRANVLHRMYKFMLDKHALHLHRGLFFVRETTIPYHQITNVHIDRPYTYRMFGIAQLDIVTANKVVEESDSKGRKFLIPIIDVSIARRLSKFLLENAARVRKEAGLPAEDYNEDEDEEEDSEEYEDAE